MKKIIFIIIASFLLGVSINAQTNSTMDKPAETKTITKPKKPIFRANKAQVMEAQKDVKSSGKWQTRHRNPRRY